MITHLAAAAVNCNTGTWQQKWNCGWNNHGTAAYRAGYEFGHNIVPVLAVLAVVIFLVRAAKKRGKSRSSATAASGARR